MRRNCSKTLISETNACKHLAFIGKMKFGSEGRNGRNLTQPPPMVGQTCRFAPISPPASAAMLAEPWGYARENIAPLVLVEIWAARQRRPTLVVVSSCARLRA
jgi:hypothetical protein